MQLKKAHIKDTSKLEGFGFAYFPKDEYQHEHWQHNGILVDKNGFVERFLARIDTLEIIAELAKADLLEFVAYECPEINKAEYDGIKRRYMLSKH